MLDHELHLFMSRYANDGVACEHIDDAMPPLGSVFFGGGDPCNICFVSNTCTHNMSQTKIGALP